MGRADTYYSASFTRVTGKKVVRTDTRSWQVPYCNDCLDHADAKERADGITAAGAYAALALGIVLAGGCALGCFSFGVAAFGPGGQVTKVERVIFALCMLGLAVACPALLWAAAVVFQRLRADAARKWQRAMQHARSLRSPRCCTFQIAVAYEGWHGSIHTFWFANPDYADAFRLANPRKVLG
jgi:hypothetical protein